MMVGDVIVNGLVAVDRGVIKGIFDKAHRIPAVFSDAPLIETGGTILSRPDRST